MLPAYKISTPKPVPIVLDRFKLGLNTVASPKSLKPNEMPICVNFKLTPDGTLETREGLTRYTTSALSNEITYFTFFPFDIDISELRAFVDTDDRSWANTDDRSWITTVPASSGTDKLIVTQPDNKLYLVDSSGVPQEQETLEGDAIIIPFGSEALVCDGSFLKYWDTDTDTVKICYDDGSGSDGYQYDNTALTPDTQIKLYSGGNTKAGVSFESQNWDSGYTITATTVEIYAKKVGSPTGDVGCEIYTDSDDSLLATSDTTYSAADIGTSSEKLTFTFSSGAMSPNTIYNAVLTYSGGDASNYIQLECDTTASGGDAVYYDGTWNDDTLKFAVAGLKPGRPPRGRYGAVHKNRAFIGGDPYNKGVLWYSNLNTLFDWSTADGGGWIGIIDNNVTNYPTGAIITFYGDLYIFGQQSQPYLCKLTGSDPADYAVSPIFQSVYSTHKTVKAVLNDIVFGNERGVNALSGVEQYGDLRTATVSDVVDDRIKDYWTDDDAVAGYYGATGQYFLKMTGYPRCLVVHTKNPKIKNNKIKYPWTEYIFVKENLSSSTYKWTASSVSNEYYVELSGGGDPSLTEPSYLIFEDSLSTNGTVGSLSDHEWDYGDNDTLGYNTIYIRDDSGDPDSTGVKIFTVLNPTAFANFANEFYIAFDDGYIYKMDTSVVQDNLNDYPFVIAGKMIESPYNEISLERYDVSCDGGTAFDFEIHESSVNIDNIHSASATIDNTVTVGTDYDRFIGLVCKEFMPVVKNISLNSPMKINNISLITKPLEM